MKLRLPSRTATGAVVLLALASGSAARASDTAVYGLNDPTEWSQGCFGGLCLCPIQLTPDVQGTAVISGATSAGTTITYDVTDVNWRVGQGAFEISYTGSGVYTRISGFAGWLHQLELDLSVNGGAPIPFDSGLVNGGGDFPDIAISISNGLDPDADCIYGTVIAVDTSPLPEDAMPCYRADFDRDLDVGFGDLTAMLSNWGACQGCTHDLSGNGVVGFEDLTDLLASWGSCS